MTSIHWLLLPLVLHVVLTTVVGLISLRQRFAAARDGRVKLNDIALNSGAWPKDARKFGNNFDNQFQSPMLAYAGAAVLLATGLVDGVSIALMWLFIVARVLHSIEHVTRNYVPMRMVLFLVSYFAVFALWMWFALRFFLIG